LVNPPAFIRRSEHEETSVSELADATLPGKASKLQVITDRTVNRHWWVSR
jgi:hypothetical protein